MSKFDDEIPIRNVFTVIFHNTCLCKNKIVVYSTSLCVNWALKTARLHSRFKMAHACQKRPNLHTNELNTTFFLFDEPLKGSKSRKTFKISLTFRFDKL
jgi:hypothetical protein